MKEHIEISFPSEISNLTSLEIDLQAVEVRFSEIVDKLAKELDIGGRSLVISVMTRASDRVGVAKRSFRWGDRYRLFISISIPSHKQTLWGLRKVEWSLWNPISDSRHFYFVEEIDYSSYNTIEDYIVDAATKALILLFTRMDSLPRSTKDRAKWWDTTRRRLDMNGKILEEEYNRNAPYSEQIRIPFLFQGQYYDHETELAYNRFRYYDAELGRYISEDPIRFDSGTTALHSYVEDTTGWIDIFGLAKSHYNGKRGEARAKHDLERSGFKNIRKQVEMMVNGKRTIADFVAEDVHGKCMCLK